MPNQPSNKEKKTYNAYVYLPGPDNRIIKVDPILSEVGIALKKYNDPNGTRLLAPVPKGYHDPRNFRQYQETCRVMLRLAETAGKNIPDPKGYRPLYELFNQRRTNKEVVRNARPENLLPQSLDTALRNYLKDHGISQLDDGMRDIVLTAMMSYAMTHPRSLASILAKRLPQPPGQAVRLTLRECRFEDERNNDGIADTFEDHVLSAAARAMRTDHYAPLANEISTLRARVYAIEKKTTDQNPDVQVQPTQKNGFRSFIEELRKDLAKEIALIRKILKERVAENNYKNRIEKADKMYTREYDAFANKGKQDYMHATITDPLIKDGLIAALRSLGEQALQDKKFVMHISKTAFIMKNPKTGEFELFYKPQYLLVRWTPILRKRGYSAAQTEALGSLKTALESFKEETNGKWYFKKPGNKWRAEVINQSPILKEFRANPYSEAFEKRITLADEMVYFAIASNGSIYRQHTDSKPAHMRQ